MSHDTHASLTGSWWLLWSWSQDVHACMFLWSGIVSAGSLLFAGLNLY